MKFLRNWLRVERPAGVALHPVRTVEIDGPVADAYARCVTGIEQILGGNIAARDPVAGTLEARFGLVNSERLTVSIERLEESRTRVTIEARRGAIPEQPQQSSSYVDALARYLQQT